jgi:hypothetical protein
VKSARAKFSISPLQSSSRIALSRASWVGGLLSVAIKIAFSSGEKSSLQLETDVFLWSEWLYTSEILRGIVCTSWLRLLLQTSHWHGLGYHNWVIWVRAHPGTRLHFCDSWQRGWMDAGQSITMSTSILKSKLIMSTHFTQLRFPPIFSISVK